MTRDLPVLPQDTDGHSAAVRRAVVTIFIVGILLQPAVHLLRGPRSGPEWFQLAGALLLIGLALWQLRSDHSTDPRGQHGFFRRHGCHNQGMQRDNGPAAPDEAAPLSGPGALAPTTGPAGRTATIRARPVFGSSGLTRLAERVRGLGGELAAGAFTGQGFLLRVVIPLSPRA